MSEFAFEYPTAHADIPARDIVYIPFGALEWHERHLPFGTDGIQAEYFAREAAKRTGGAVLPALHFGTDRETVVDGATFHGMDARAGRLLPGSVYWMPPALFTELVRQIVGNCIERGFRTVVGISAHAGTAQHDALKAVERDLPAFVAITGREFPGGGDHAGRIETEIMLAIRPDLVRQSKLGGELIGVLGDDPRVARRDDGLQRVASIIAFIVTRVGAPRA